MISETIQEDLKIMVKRMMKERGIEKYTVQIEGQTAPGDNFSADVIFFKVTTEGESSSEYKLVMKTAKRSEEVRKLAGMTDAYNRELFLYSVVFPSFQNLIQEENSNFEIDFLPKLYRKESDLLRETLIIQNMSAIGYKLWDRMKPWNLAHSLLAVEYYGKLHALSFALKAKQPELFRNFSKDLWNIAPEFCKMPNAEKFYTDSWNNMILAAKKGGRIELVKKLEEIGKEVTDILTGSAAEEDRLVLCHGDCWNNNFMFKYENQNNDTPSKMCFLDFQISLLDSPARDLCHNIYTTCDKTCLDHFDLLIQTYYRSLSESVRSLGCNLDDIFTYEDLSDHLKKYSKYGLVVSPIVLKLAVAAQNEVPDLETSLKSEDKIPHYDISNEDEFMRRLLDVAEHYVERFV